MTRIFVSYSRSVKTEVSDIIRLLKATGYDVWWDGDIPSISDWWATICEHIEWCEVFIFFVSEKSVESPYCLAELKYGTDRNRPILPFLIDDHTQYTIPPEVTPLRNQWFEYDGDAADVIKEVNRAVAHTPWPQFRDNPVPRPPEPKTGSGSTARAFQQAVTLAKNGHFEQAILRFRDIRSNDFKTWGKRCDNWIRCVQLYAQISELIDHTATHYQVPNKWREYQKVTRRLGDSFDPFDLAPKAEMINSGHSRLWRLGLSALAVVLIVGILGIALLLTRDDDPNQSSPQKTTATDDLFAAADTATSMLSTTPASTDTSEPTNADTPEPSNTFTSEPTNTYTPRPTDTFTPEPSSTYTAEPTNTSTSQPTATPTVDLSFPWSGSISEPSDTPNGPPDIQLRYTAEYFLLKNVSGRRLDIRLLAFEGDENGFFAASAWADSGFASLNSFRNDGCVQVATDPSTVFDSTQDDDCHYHNYFMWDTTSSRHFWLDTEGNESFAVFMNGELIAECPIAESALHTTYCEFALP
jgi:hypothetical protein